MKSRSKSSRLYLYSAGVIIQVLASSSNWAELDLHRNELTQNERQFESRLRQTRTSVNAPALSPLNQEVEVILAPNERTILYNQNSTPLLSSQVSLPVKNIYFRMGEHFRKGDVLMDIDDTIFKVNLLKAKASFQRAQALVISRQRLYADHIASFLDLKEAEAAFASAEAELVLAEEQLAQTQIIAPYDGRVVQLLIQQYELPQPGQALIEIVNDKTLIAKLLAPSVNLNYLKIGKYLRIHIKETDTDEYARIVRIGAVIDPASGTIAVDAEIENYDEKYVPGMTGTTTIGSITDHPSRENEPTPPVEKAPEKPTIHAPPPPSTQMEQQRPELQKEMISPRETTHGLDETAPPNDADSQKRLFFFRHVYDMLFSPGKETTEEEKRIQQELIPRGYGEERNGPSYDTMQNVRDACYEAVSGISFLRPLDLDSHYDYSIEAEVNRIEAEQEKGYGQIAHPSELERHPESIQDRASLRESESVHENSPEVLHDQYRPEMQHEHRSDLLHEENRSEMRLEENYQQNKPGDRHDEEPSLSPRVEREAPEAKPTLSQHLYDNMVKGSYLTLSEWTRVAKEKVAAYDLPQKEKPAESDQAVSETTSPDERTEDKRREEIDHPKDTEETQIKDETVDHESNQRREDTDHPKDAEGSQIKDETVEQESNQKREDIDHLKEAEGSQIKDETVDHESNQRREDADHPNDTEETQRKDEHVNHETSKAHEVAISDSNNSISNVASSESYILYLAEEASAVGQVEDNRPFYQVAYDKIKEYFKAMFGASEETPESTKSEKKDTEAEKKDSSSEQRNEGDNNELNESGKGKNPTSEENIRENLFNKLYFSTSDATDSASDEKKNQDGEHGSLPE